MMSHDATAFDTLDNLRNEIGTLEQRLDYMRREVERMEPLPQFLEVLACATGDVHVGVPLAAVEHVVGIARLTPAHNAPSWIRGQLDLRGVMIPVVEVGVRFGHAPREMDVDDFFVLCSTPKGRVGFWVQSVSGVTRVASNSLERHSPEILSKPYILGIAAFNGTTTYILRVDAMVGRFEASKKDA